MKHAVLMLAYNTTEAQLRLTKLCYESILEQDCDPASIWIVDNGSSPETGTWEWMKSLVARTSIHLRHYDTNTAPTHVANRTADDIWATGVDTILGISNDIIAPRNLYSEMLKWPRGFVAAHADGPMPPDLPQNHTAVGKHEDIHCAVMMTRKWAHDALVAKDGYFLDPGYFHYASDVDLKLRMAACGIHGVQLDIQAYHYGSAGWRLAIPEVGRAINEQADRDREFFASKWGFGIGSSEHEAAIKDVNFKG